MIKFSLILPTYNVEEYLPKCLESCIHQDLPPDEYEIIVVIDGSPDNSLAVAKKYESQYNNIKIVERTNGGLSAARNTGLKYAVGEYVWFIDSDDYIEHNILQNIYSEMDNEKLEGLWIGWRDVDEKGNILPEFVSHFFHKNQLVLTGIEFMSSVLNTSLYAWSFIYNRTFLNSNNLTFTEGMYYEDTDFAFRCIPKVHRIKLLDKICYNYLQRNNSIVHSIDFEKVRDLCKNCVTANMAQRKASPELKRFYRSCFTAMYLSLIKKIIKSNNSDFKAYVIEKTKYHKLGKVDNFGDVKTRFIGFIYNHFGIKNCFRLFSLMFNVMSIKHSEFYDKL